MLEKGAGGGASRLEHASKLHKRQEGAAGLRDQAALAEQEYSQE